jgi:hypothetical protein
LRTLSTVSIHENVSESVAGDVAKLIRAKETPADAPASEMPKEIGGGRSDSVGKEDRS